jgi:hypothetical protein
VADFADQQLRVTDLVTDSVVIADKSFERCVILGPAVVVPAGSRFIGCSFEGEPDAVVWEIPPSRTTLVGAIRLENCSFNACEFRGVGLGLGHDAAKEFLDALDRTEQADREQSVAH